MRLVFVIAGIAIVAGGCCNNHFHSEAHEEYTAHSPIVVLPLSVSEDATIDYIRISREVKNPGYYRWVNGMTLTDAVSSAGGLSVFAGRSAIHVFHKDHSLVGIYDYDAILKHKIGDPILASGDYIFVGGSLD